MAELSYTFGAYITNSITITPFTDASEIWLTVKQSKNQTDAESILQISKTGGLLYLNGPLVSPITSTDGTLTVANSILTITLSAAASALLLDRTLLGEIKTKTALGIVAVNSTFDFIISNALTRAI